MNCPGCGNLMAPCEATAYRCCEECYVTRCNRVPLTGGLKVRSGGLRRNAVGWEHIGETHKVADRRRK